MEEQRHQPGQRAGEATWDTETWRLVGVTQIKREGALL